MSVREFPSFWLYGLLSALLVLCFSLLPSCSLGKQDLDLNPPATPPLSRLYIGYAVVADSYVHILSSPDSAGVSLGYFRRGTILQALERRMVRSGASAESWLLVDGKDKGWLNEKSVRIYDTEAKAMTAARGEVK
jgi:hypothetical protein